MNKYTGERTLLRIVAGPGGRNFYSEEIRERDRLIYIELSQNGQTIEYPYSIKDLMKMWELVFDVWVKPEKIISYAEAFRKLISFKLAQRKLDGMAQAYMAKRGKPQGD